jgi:hypothetical protein
MKFSARATRFQDTSLLLISYTIIVEAESDFSKVFREVLEGIKPSFHTSIEEPTSTLL